MTGALKIWDGTTWQYAGYGAGDPTKANLASPTFTGTVTVPTPVNATDAVTKTYADTALNLKANLAGPTFTGTVGGITAAMVNAFALSVVTTKGDVVGATGNAAIGRTAVGVDGQSLVANSANANGIGWGQEKLTAKRTTSIASSSSTMSAMGLSVTVRAGITYHFRGRGQYQVANVATGLGVRVNGTCTATGIRAESFVYQTTSNGFTSRQQNALGQTVTGAAATTAITTDYPWAIEGTIRVNAGGTLFLEFLSSSNTAATTISADSDWIVEEI